MPHLSGRLMASEIPGPRKQRTRQHVIADLSVHHVERFILEAGHTAQRLGSDYGYDLLVSTFDEQGYVDQGRSTFSSRLWRHWPRVEQTTCMTLIFATTTFGSRRKCLSFSSCLTLLADAPTGSPSNNTSRRASLSSRKRVLRPSASACQGGRR